MKRGAANSYILAESVRPALECRSFVILIVTVVIFIVTWPIDCEMADGAVDNYEALLKTPRMFMKIAGPE